MVKGISSLIALVLVIGFVVATVMLIFHFGKDIIAKITAPVPGEIEKVQEWAFENLEISTVEGNKITLLAPGAPSAYTVLHVFVDGAEKDIINSTSGEVIYLELNETVPRGARKLGFLTNTGRVWYFDYYHDTTWLEGWDSRKGIVIDNTNTSELENYSIAVDPKVTVTHGLIFSTHMNDNGSVLYDYSGKNNDGSIYGAVLVDGKLGKALYFDGIDDYVEVEDNPTLNPETVTLVLWFYIRDSGGDFDRLINKEPPYDIMFGNVDGSLKYSFSRSDGTTTGIITFATISKNQWYHLAISYDHGVVTAYLNGEKIYSTDDGTGLGLNMSGGENLIIGRRFVGSDPINATIDEIRIYNRTLTGPSTNCTVEPNNEVCQLYLAKTSLEDLRFTDLDGNELNYYHETDSRVWVKVPKIKANTTEAIYMYYGNSEAVTKSSFSSVFSGLVAYWPLDEGSGDNIYDVTSNANDGTVYDNEGDQWVWDSEVGWGLNFDGVDDYAEVPESSSLKITSQITLAYRFKPTYTSRADRALDKSDSYALHQEYTGYRILIWQGGVENWCYSGDNTSQQGIWQHITGTYNGSAMRIYIDGDLKNEVAFSGTIDDVTSNVTIGDWVAGGTGEGLFAKTAGVIDDVMIYNRSLTAEEIAQLAAKKPKTITGSEEK